MTEHNIFQEIDDQLERQQLEAFWKRYGKWIVAAAVIIIVGTAGMTVWRNWQTEKHQAATDSLIEVMTSKSNTDPVKQIEALGDFAEKNGGTSQAAFARLQAGAMAVKEGNIEKALSFYDGLARDTQADPAFRQLADLLAVQAQVDTGNPAELEKRLQPLTADEAPWRYTAKEYQGYLALKSGDEARAVQIFTALSQDMGAPESLRTRAGEMLHTLAD